jgi:hypothetical protein
VACAASELRFEGMPYQEKLRSLPESDGLLLEIEGNAPSYGGSRRLIIAVEGDTPHDAVLRKRRAQIGESFVLEPACRSLYRVGE